MKLNFVKFTYLYFIISLLFIVPSIISLVAFGLKPSIDFTGGSLIELAAPDSTTSPSDLSQSFADQGIQSVQTTDTGFILRFATISSEEKITISSKLASDYPQLTELRFENIGPVLGKELLQKTAVAIILATLLILGFIAYQFQDLKYGICAVIAMFHDSIIVIGAFSLLGHFLSVEVDTLTVTALLTILSFSVHDTIVVYDRIRESSRRFPKLPFATVVNQAITETLSRSINNSMTIIFMLSSLVLLGGESIRWFVLALLIGTITGTYSSTFTAAPLLILWQKHIAPRLHR